MAPKGLWVPQGCEKKTLMFNTAIYQALTEGPLGTPWMEKKTLMFNTAIHQALKPLQSFCHHANMMGLCSVRWLAMGFMGNCSVAWFSNDILGSIVCHVFTVSHDTNPQPQPHLVPQTCIVTISGNNIGDDGAGSLASALKTSTTFKCLRLRGVQHEYRHQLLRLKGSQISRTSQHPGSSSGGREGIGSRSARQYTTGTVPKR